MSLPKPPGKETEKNVQQEHQKNYEKMGKRLQSLQEHRRKVEAKAAGDKERVTALFTDLRIRLEDLEKRALRENSEQAERISRSVLEGIWDLETKKNKLRMDMAYNMHGHSIILQESDTGDLSDTEDGDNNRLLHDVGNLDVTGMLHKGLSDIIAEVNAYFPLEKAADILLDGNTAHNDLQISDDGKTVSRSQEEQNRPETSERFRDSPQVLSNQRFSSGRHYWDVDVGGSDWWRVGVCYPSMERRGWKACIGYNNESWCLVRSSDRYMVAHGGKEILLFSDLSSNRVRIFVDYEAGRISFYDLCDQFRLLRTFTTTFTEHFHIVLWVGGGSVKI